MQSLRIFDRRLVTALLTAAVVVPSALGAQEPRILVGLTLTRSDSTPLDLEAPPSLGEPDLVRVVQLLPGTVAKNDFTTATKCEPHPRYDGWYSHTRCAVRSRVVVGYRHPYPRAGNGHRNAATSAVG